MGGAEVIMLSIAKPEMTALRELTFLRAEAAGCRRCPLWANATQTVFEEITTANVSILGLDKTP